MSNYPPGMSGLPEDFDPNGGFDYIDVGVWGTMLDAISTGDLEDFTIQLEELENPAILEYFKEVLKFAISEFNRREGDKKAREYYSKEEKDR